MTIGSSPDDFPLLILLGLSALAIPPLLLGLGALLERLLHIPVAGFSLIFMVVLAVGGIIGGSLALDAGGRTAIGLVADKTEQVRLRRQGDWRHSFSAELRYRLDGSSPSPQLPTIEDSASSLGLSAAQFDALRAGEPVALRLLPILRSITLVRLADASTRDWIPWGPIAGALGVAGMGWLAFRVGRSRAGCGLVLAVALIGGLGLPSAIIYGNWRAMEDLAAKPLRAEATVRAIARVVMIDPLPCEKKCSGRLDTEFEVPQQYDIVELAFTPQGARDEVIAVDAADVGSLSLERGARLEIAYAAADPRAAQIIGATHAHHWKNMLGFAGIMLGPVVALAALVLALAFAWLRKRSSRSLGRQPQRP